MIKELFKRLGLAPDFIEHEAINASIEDKLRDNDKAVERIKEGLGRRLTSNEHLRQSISHAKDIINNH